jgi:2-iminobutanoate/2-iminopropanoate deaminase
MKSIMGCMLILVVVAGFAACGNSNASGTTTKKVIFTNDAPTPIGPYSQGILFGDALYCAGQIGINPDTGKLVEGGAAAEADQAIKNLGAVLAAANMNYDDAVMATIFLTDLNDYPAVNEVYAKYFKNNPPAREAVAVSAIPGNANVEVSLIAIKGSN